MTTSDQVKTLVKRHADGDDERFYSVALQVAARAARSGHRSIAQHAETLLRSWLWKINQGRPLGQARLT